jgi:CRISPR/Cas system endoribonuclease Cas6 (RAMP superfamily)
MRIKIIISNNGSYQQNHQHIVNSFIHRVLGKNNDEYHDAKNEYSISSLQGGKLVELKY